MKKETKKSFLDSKRATLVCALLVSILAWVIVAGFINPGDSKTIAHVRIDFNRKEQDYQNKNLQMVSDQEAVFAEVQVKGDSPVISGLTNTDVAVYADYSGVNGPGTHIVPLRAEKIAAGNYSISKLSIKTPDHSLKRSPRATVTLTFEEIEVKTFKIDVKADHVRAAPGYFRDMPLPSTAEVTITGPKNNIARVQSVQANIVDDVEDSKNLIYSGVPLMILDAAGNELNPEVLHLSLSVDSIEVDIPILEIREIDLKVDFVGVPQNFDIDWLKKRVHLSTNKLKVVGSSEDLDKLSGQLVIAEIDLSELRLNWESEPVDIQLPPNSNLQNHDQLKQVVISFDSDGLVEKVFDVSNMPVVHVPKNTTIHPLADNVPNVRLLGPPEQIDRLLDENIVVEIDAFNIPTSASGQQSIPARVLIPSTTQVFAIDSYPVICDVDVSPE